MTEIDRLKILIFTMENVSAQVTLLRSQINPLGDYTPIDYLVSDILQTLYTKLAWMPKD